MSTIGAAKVSGAPPGSECFPRKEVLRIVKNVMDLLDERGYLTLERLCPIYEKTFNEELNAHKLLSVLGSQDLATAIRDFRPRIFEHLTTATGEIAIAIADDPEVDALEDELDGVDQPKPSGGATASPSTGPSDLPRDSAQPSTPSMPPRNTLTLPPTPIPAVKTAPLFNLSRLPQRGRPAIAPAQRAPLVIVKKMAAARPVLNGTHPIPRNDQAAAGNGAAQSVPKTGEPAPQAPNSTQMAQPVVNGAHPPSNYAQPAHPTTTAAALPELKNAEPAQRPVGAVQPIMKRAEPTQPVSTAAHPTSTRAVAAPQEFGQRAFTSDRQPVSVPATKPVEPPKRSVRDVWRAKWETAVKPKKERWEEHVDYVNFLHLAARDRAICLNEYLSDVARPIWTKTRLAKYSADSIAFLLQTHFAGCFEVSTQMEGKYEIRAVPNCLPTTKLESLRKIMTGAVRVEDVSARIAVGSTHSVMVKPGLNDDDHDVILVPFGLLRGAAGGSDQNANAENGLPECHVAYQRKIRPLLRKLRGNCRFTELKPGACVLHAKERCVIQESDGYEFVVRSLDTGELRRARADELYDPLFVDEFTAYPSLLLYARVAGYRCRQTKEKVRELKYGLTTAKFLAYKPLPDGRILQRVELSSSNTTPSPPPPPNAIKEQKTAASGAGDVSGAISLTDLLGPNADPDLLAALQQPCL